MELGSGEILLILLLALLIYGGRLPDVARAVGHSFGELKRGLSETKDAVASQLDSVAPDEPEAPHREVLRRAHAPEELAKEDISAPEGGAQPPRDPQSGAQDPARPDGAAGAAGTTGGPTSA